MEGQLGQLTICNSPVVRLYRGTIRTTTNIGLIVRLYRETIGTT